MSGNKKWIKVDDVKNASLVKLNEIMNEQTAFFNTQKERDLYNAITKNKTNKYRYDE